MDVLLLLGKLIRACPRHRLLTGADGKRRRRLRAAYKQWREKVESPLERADKAVERLASFGYRPTISLVMPAYNTPPRILEAAIRSVLA